MPDITIVTPWWNHPELAEDYFKATANVDAEVLIIDNGSNPPLPNAVRLDWNSGFSYASNVGLRLAQTDAVLFLNNDVYMTSPDWLEKIREALEPDVLVGPKIRFDPHADVDGERFPYLDGWCLAGMTEDLLELGGFDEDYEEPSYYSDNDLCLRARAAGMTLREVPAGIGHKSGMTSQANGWVLPSTASNRRRYEALARELMGAAV